MKKTKKKEEPLQKVALKVIFIDKDFKHSWAMDFRKPDVERYQKMDAEYFKRIWEQYSGNGITAVLKNAPKNWKSHEAYAKKFEKVMTAKTKENEKRMKKGKGQMPKKEWRKGIPVFKSTLKATDVRAIVVGENCWTRVFTVEALTAKAFQKIINDYEL